MRREGIILQRNMCLAWGFEADFLRKQGKVCLSVFQMFWLILSKLSTGVKLSEILDSYRVSGNR